jgi:Macrocin-O-methyltransferase (TylF)
MTVQERLVRFARKPLPNKWASLKAVLQNSILNRSHAVIERRRLQKLLIGAHAPPRVLQTRQKIYLAFRPDSDAIFSLHPEIAKLSEKWVRDNVDRNAGDLPRLYAIIFNTKQILEDKIQGDIAELGVYRGNSAAIFGHFARKYRRRLFLFDTFDGFDQRDLVGTDASKNIEFADTSLGYVRELVGDESVRFVQGRFPRSIPPDLSTSRFCLVHIDCDLYEPAKAGLEFFYPRLSPGGLLIVHDYANPYWIGIKRAVDEFCDTVPEKPLVFGDKSGTAMIRKSLTSQNL